MNAPDTTYGPDWYETGRINYYNLRYADEEGVDNTINQYGSNKIEVANDEVSVPPNIEEILGEQKKL